LHPRQTQRTLCPFHCTHAFKHLQSIPQRWCLALVTHLAQSDSSTESTQPHHAFYLARLLWLHLFSIEESGRHLNTAQSISNIPESKPRIFINPTPEGARLPPPPRPPTNSTRELEADSEICRQHSSTVAHPYPPQWIPGSKHHQ